MYPGDDKMRAFTQKHKKRRISGNDDDGHKKVKTGTQNKVTEITYDSFKKAIHRGRLCKTVAGLQEHFNSVGRSTNNNQLCEVCGRKCVWQCNKCNKFICTVNKRTVEKKKWNGVNCLFTYHNPEFFGLARSDCQDPTAWVPPTPQIMEKNARMIRRWMNNDDSDDDWK